MEVLVDGQPVRERDVRGCDLNRLFAEEAGEVSVDGALGRLEIVSPEERVGRPCTWVGRQVGSRGWRQTSVHFGNQIRGWDLGLFGWSGSTVDRGANRGCERQVVKVRLGRTSREGGADRLAMTWGASERGVPGPGVRYPGRTLRDRWGALSGEACRNVGARTRLWLRGRMDTLDRTLKCPDVGKSVERDDWSARGSFGGTVRLSERRAMRWTASVGKAHFEDTERRRCAPFRSTLHVEYALRSGRDVRTGVWGEGKTHSEYESTLDGGLWGVLPFAMGKGFVMASVARMSRWPSFDERYWSDYDRADSLSALDLSAEHTLRCWLEMGLPLDGGAVRSALFWERDEDPIGWDPRVGGRLANLPRTECMGWEIWATSDKAAAMLTAKTQRAHTPLSLCPSAREQGNGEEPPAPLPPCPSAAFRWGLNYRYEHVKRTQTGSVKVLHRPRHRGKVWVQGSRAFFKGALEPGLFLGAEYVGASRGYDEAQGKEVPLKGAVFIQVRLEVQVLEDFNVFYLMDNALDASYQSRWGYPAQARSFRWGLVWALWD